MNRTRRRR